MSYADPESGADSALWLLPPWHLLWRAGRLVTCGGLEPVAVAGDRQHGGVVETRLVEAAGVDPPRSPYFLIL